MDSITGNPIEGAKFQIWYGSNSTTTGELNDLGTYFTDERGEIVLEGLRDGWYKVTELEPAHGFTIKEPATQEFYITGGKDTVFAKKYITPLAGCRAFRAYAFDRQAEAAVIDSFVAACGALAAEGPGFEFEVRARLSAVCLALCRHFAPDFAAGRTKPNQDEARIQQMLAFIQEHFDRPLTLAEIASAAGIGERECLRCFGKTIHIPPMQYLLKYRIMQGADALLARPADSVAQIAARCGFDNPSNFSQQFRRFYGCSPREYRNRKQ